MLFRAVTLFVLLTSAYAATTVNLGTAGNFAVLTKTGITTTGVTSVTGDMGTSPIAGTAITGFALTMAVGNTHSTSTLVNGNVMAADYTSPTPATMTTAISNMAAAYTDAAGRSDDATHELAAGLIEGKTLTPGLYTWTTNIEYTSSLTFDGESDADAVWILQTSKNVVVGNGANVVLSGGAQAKNIFWQVAGHVVFGTTAHAEGVFLAAEQIVFNTGSSLNGAALSQTAVTLDATTIVKESDNTSQAAVRYLRSV
jgi:hypothetical protein